MEQKSIKKTTHTPQEITALIRMFFSHMQIRLTEYQSHENLLGTYAVHLLPVHSISTGFCGTGRTAEMARAGAYLQCLCDLCTQPDLPFYSLRNKQICSCSRMADTVTCAGDTPETALIQGISELFSRKAAAGRHLLSAAPEISESVLTGCQEARRMYRLLKQQYGDSTRLFDISGSGIQFSAALEISYEQNQETVCTYSAHPDPDIALERLLVNAMHGTRFSDALYYGESGKNIDLQAFLQSLLRQGYDIRIADCSCAGLSVYQVMIPELTAVLPELPHPKRVTHTLAFHAAAQRCREYRAAHPANPEQLFAGLIPRCG